MGDAGSSLPNEIHNLYAKGSATEAAVKKLADGGEQFEVAEIESLVEATKPYRDNDSATLLLAYFEAKGQNQGLDAQQVARWSEAHPNDLDAVIDCLKLKPPHGITVLRRLPKRGSQKRVFVATWEQSHREVVLKAFLGDHEQVQTLLGREKQSHPLSIDHPNVIKTHIISNKDSDPFVVESFLDQVLDDNWRPRGEEDAANLAFDIASALCCLHEQQMLHGDVKPDNLGRDHDRYVLLDFGVARPWDALDEVHPTGSLRTRAPELLLEGRYTYPSRVDIWALGAVLFNCFEGRFPMFDEGEVPPRSSNPDARADFIELLKKRVSSEWDTRLKMQATPIRFRPLIEEMLAPDPARRLEAPAVRLRIADNLPTLLRRGANEASVLSPAEELNQIKKYLATGDSFSVMPARSRDDLRFRLKYLRHLVDDESRAEIESLLSRLESDH